MSRKIYIALAGTFIVLSSCIIAPEQKVTSLFDGKTFAGWEGDTIHTWKIENGALVGGSLDKTVPNNNFLCTRKQYGDFILKLKFRLRGTEGFVNGGVQFNSVRSKSPDYEMIGYQADLGDKFWAGLYDESRRNKTLVTPDSTAVLKLLKRNDWNDYEVRSQKGHIQIFLNGKQTVDYTEPDQSIPQQGIIGLQVHGGGKTEAGYKDISIQEL